MNDNELDNELRVELRELAEVAYNGYTESTGGKTWDGKPVPVWAALPEAIQLAWAAAAVAALRHHQDSMARERDGEMKVDPITEGWGRLHAGGANHYIRLRSESRFTLCQIRVPESVVLSADLTRSRVGQITLRCSICASTLSWEVEHARAAR